MNATVIATKIAKAIECTKRIETGLFPIAATIVVDKLVDLVLHDAEKSND